MAKTTGSSRQAALLLEVVVALSIMVASLALLGAQLVGGMQMTSQAERLTRAAALMDRLLALVDLDPQMQEQVQYEKDSEGDFGDQNPGWFWHINVEPTDIAGLSRLRAEVLYQEDASRPKSRDEAKPVRDVSLLKAAPGRIDLVKDFGADEEQVAQLAAMMPIANFDPTNIDPQALVALATEDPSALLELLPALLPLLGQLGGTGGLAGGPRGMSELAALGGGLDEFGEGFAGSGDDLEQLQELLRRRGEGMAPPGGGGGTGPPGAAAFGGGGAPGRGGPGMGGPRGRGGQPGAGQPGGGQPRGGGQPPGAGRPRGGNQPPGGGQPPGGRQPRGGAGSPGRTPPPPGGGQGGDQRQYTIEDLLRLRDEMQQKQGGR